MKKFFKHWRLGIKIWYELNYHVQMNHWKAASNICKRIDRLKVNKWYIKLI